MGHFELDVEFKVETNSATAILGPSGSGKTLILRTIAGLTDPAEGRIYIGGKPLYDSSMNINKPPRHRRAGFVFQDYALFPHLTVAGNLAYGFDGKKRAAETKVSELVQLLSLNGLESRRPLQLSGGQRQRVAIGRALASDPDFLLLDEPFSAVDAPTRATLTEQLLELESRVSVPTVLVTHDLEEAHALAQMIVVLDNGRLLQSGPTREVFRNPISPRVGELLGVRNMLSGRVAKVGILATVEAAGMVMEVEVSGLALDQPVIAGVRPRDLQAFPEPTGNALLVREVDAGTRRTLVLQLQGGSHVYAELTREMDLKLGQSTLPSQWQVSVAPGGGFVWPANGTK